MTLDELLCEKCGKDVGDTLYRVRSVNPYGSVRACRECAVEVRERRRSYASESNYYSHPPRLWKWECTCGRIVVFEATEEGAPRLWFYCSRECKRDAARARRTDRRQWARLCQVCGQSFQARRNDAKTCSARCRKRLQRAASEKPAERIPAS